MPETTDMLPVKCAIRLMAMRPTKPIFVLPLFLLIVFLLIVLVAGTPDEAVGRVTKVIDGDTFDVHSKTARSMRTLLESGLQILIARKPEALGLRSWKERIRLYPILAAEHLHFSWIWTIRQAKTSMIVGWPWLILARMACRAETSTTKCLLMAGHADIKDFENDEFNPETWWS